MEKMEKEALAQRIERLTLELVNCRSVVATSDELAMSELVYKVLSDLPYWKQNPQLLVKQPFINDPLGRFSVVARLEGQKDASKKTVITIGHTDTVGISDYGDFKGLATKPEALIEALKTVTLSEEAKADLDSGEWLFGRGILDMKCGVAIIISLLELLSGDVENLSGNIVFAAVGDEEGNSGGMLSVVPELVRLQEKEGYEYLAVLDTDYMAPRYEGDEDRYIYIGTVGKLMPSFYVIGKETHVGDPFKGLDPNQIAGAIIHKINKNVAFSDVADGEVSLPPITLQQRDQKEEYSVQIARATNLYFNYATHKSTPDEVMSKMIRAAHEAFSDVVNVLNERYDIYCKASRMEHRLLPWRARVISYQALYEAVKEERGEAVLKAHIEALKAEMLKDPSIDERLFGQRIVEAVHSLWSFKDPIVIVYFSPPYYPHNYVKGNWAKDVRLLEAVDQAIQAQGSARKVLSRKFYPYISDLSFVSAPKNERIVALQNNMPAYGSRYKLPIEDMQKLSLPVVNIGPYGKDAHQFTERIQRDYSFNVAPQLVYETLLALLEERESSAI
ncbi:M20/M25/M40 family metallo-hydrolase [Acidaminobacter sp.]|uniref:M20/M25/M40 family metallo-hydrolase n=1 Tax=Acidaminobacter sp. TaxID=1872102 RepID=UPI0025C6E61C|nr:M20/M25/M40 family metallo-hydrolase [Acidaminobacter sp.]